MLLKTTILYCQTDKTVKEEKKNQCFPGVFCEWERLSDRTHFLRLWELHLYNNCVYVVTYLK